jgi:hypothetical protein
VCNSEHGPDEYAKGWFILPNNQVLVVDGGEAEVMAYAKDNGLQVFWNAVSLESALNDCGLTLPPGGI